MHVYTHNTHICTGGDREDGGRGAYVSLKMLGVGVEDDRPKYCSTPLVFDIPLPNTHNHTRERELVYL